MSLPTPGADPEAAAERRSRLVGIKLRALVGGGDPVPFAPGAALLDGSVGWVLLDDRPDTHPDQRLGAAIVWALRAGAGRLNVIAESGTGVLARRAAEFDLPIDVWHAEGRTLLPAVAEPSLAPLQVPEAHRRFAEVIDAAGAVAVEEHGVLAGEVGGLEVCRVVDDAYTGATRLDVGVGVHDREAFAMLHGDEPTAAALARIVAAVSRHRRLDAAPHPLNRLARERLLRHELISAPDLVGAVALRPASPPVPRRNLKDPVPCVAIGAAGDGSPLVVVCSVGADLDLVPFAADARLAVRAAAPDVEPERTRLVVVTPERDRLPVILEIAARLREPAEFVTLG